MACGDQRSRVRNEASGRRPHVDAHIRLGDLRTSDHAMIQRPHIDWFALAPMTALFAAGALALMAAVLVPRRARRTTGAVVCALGYAVAFGFAIALYARSPHAQGVIADSLRRDRFGQFAQMILAASGLLAVGVSFRERMRDDHVAEYYALLAFAGGGMLFFVTANNLLTLFLGLEWLSLSLYILCAVDRDLIGGLEAGLKYLIVGGFGSAVLLFGSALVYGESGRLDFPGIAAAGRGHDALFLFGLAMLISGLAFKASAAPFHMWTPDVYEGAPTPVTAFMAAATKTAALERELGVPVTFENMAGFGWERPLLGAAMWTFMLGFAGFPLTGGFVGKFYVFSAAYDRGWTWLVIVGVVATLVSLYYYLGLIRAMFMRRGEDLQLAPVGGSPPREGLLHASVLVCLAVTVVTF